MTNIFIFTLVIIKDRSLRFLVSNRLEITIFDVLSKLYKYCNLNSLIFCLWQNLIWLMKPTNSLLKNFCHHYCFSNVLTNSLNLYSLTLLQFSNAERKLSSHRSGIKYFDKITIFILTSFMILGTSIVFQLLVRLSFLN